MSKSDPVRGMGGRETVEGDLDLGSVGRSVWRKKWWVLLPAIAVGAIAFVGVNLMTPRYKSEARILIDPRENVFLRPEAEKTGDRDRAVIDPEAVTSQVQLVLSRDVARRVIKELKLNENPEFDPVLGGFSPLRQVLILLGISRDPLRMTPDERLLESYIARVNAFPVEKSRVIAIEFQSADPELAARGANAIADVYLDLQQSVKQDQTRAAGRWLAGEIDGLRTRVADAEAKADEFRSRSNLFVGTNNTTLSNQQLGEVNTQLASARSQASEAEAKARLIRDMLKSGRAVETADVANSEIIRRLNEQRVTLRAQLAEQSSTLLDGHPRIKELRAQIGDLERQIRSEAEKLVRSLENDAKISNGRVEQLAANFETLKRQAAGTNEQDVQLRALEREAKAQRDLLESYLAKYREATARENLAAAPADGRIISRAFVSNTPYFPKKLPIVLIASLGTLLLGIGFVTTGELLSRSGDRSAVVRRDAVVADAEGRDAGWPTRAAAPPLVDEPATTLAPAQTPIAGMPAAAKIAALAEGLRGQGARLITVAGLDEGEATARVALDLARALAVQSRVVLVDLAFAAPKASAQGAGVPGVAELARGAASFGQIIGRDPGSRLHVVSAGTSSSGGASVLASERLPVAIDALAQSYDHVVIDAGPVTEMQIERMAKFAPHAVLVTAGATAEIAALALDELKAGGFTGVSTVADAAAANDDVARKPVAA